ncbi:hypothetical protein GPAL_0056 [Glaciecola pallidula DSM 14239 = ACAM 615]|uniref:Uncharacterized protein n=1 Tax=Brumicola pallidula DSM 14239 = ACAM 615 TaxID=1121922 RepID=K6ZDA0_9ALTE|nr:hypothetical protein GPAL_0056 [Glaciecola pallidula DSM 14239 = ACAM 615]
MLKTKFACVFLPATLPATFPATFPIMYLMMLTTLENENVTQYFKTTLKQQIHLNL